MAMAPKKAEPNKSASRITINVLVQRHRDVRVTGGFGCTFGNMVDEMIHVALDAGDTVQSFTINIDPADWDMLKASHEGVHDVMLKDSAS